jgi:predicted HAD superfamily phosphohydrolase YqeG
MVHHPFGNYVGAMRAGDRQYVMIGRLLHTDTRESHTSQMVVTVTFTVADSNDLEP